MPRLTPWSKSGWMYRFGDQGGCSQHLGRDLSTQLSVSKPQPDSVKLCAGKYSSNPKRNNHSHRCQEGFCNESGSSIKLHTCQPLLLQKGIELGFVATYEKLHLGNFFIHLLHELNDEINQLVFEHFFRMGIRDQE